jgi:hypothetical protein
MWKKGFQEGSIGAIKTAMAIITRNPRGRPSTSMKIGSLRKFVSACCFLALSVAFPACQQQRVTLTPVEDDLVILNGCVISACNYLAVVKTQHSLEDNFWAKILMVRFVNHPAGHAYCVWETEGNIYGYDRNSGAFPLPVYTRDARSIAIVLAQELSRVLNEPLAVSTAGFVESKEAELFKFSSLDLAQRKRTETASLQLASATTP